VVYVLVNTVNASGQNVTIKSGQLSKRGKRNPQYHRYHFVLKGDVLSYYNSASNQYFPRGNIDLRYGISAELIPDMEKEKDATSFSVTTNKCTYYFRADSAPNAKEWVKQLQKVIFRSRNDGDSVKISLPIDNIVDIEENALVDFAETIKIRIVDNDETFAVDEVS
jgi:sterol 3beta-glucosyltransferase